MEITVEERMTGRRLRERILAKYGSREALERMALDPHAGEAHNDLADLQLLDEDPRRLDSEMRVASICIFDPDEIDELTPARLRLLDTLARSKRGLSVTQLAARAKRDKKNVSEDLKILCRLGLVEMQKRGREKIPRPLGNSIHIVLVPERARS